MLISHPGGGDTARHAGKLPEAFALSFNSFPFVTLSVNHTGRVQRGRDSSGETTTCSGSEDLNVTATQTLVSTLYIVWVINVTYKVSRLYPVNLLRDTLTGPSGATCHPAPSDLEWIDGCIT